MNKWTDDCGRDRPPATVLVSQDQVAIARGRVYSAVADEVQDVRFIAA
jgi:hypothetical protein